MREDTEKCLQSLGRPSHCFLRRHEFCHFTVIKNTRIWFQSVAEANDDVNEQVLPSLPEMENSSFVMPSMGRGSCGLLDVDTLWEEKANLAEERLMNHQLLNNASAMQPISSWMSNQTAQLHLNSYFDGLLAISEPFYLGSMSTFDSANTHTLLPVAVSEQSATVSTFSSFPSSRTHEYPDHSVG